MEERPLQKSKDNLLRFGLFCQFYKDLNEFLLAQPLHRELDSTHNIAAISGMLNDESVKLFKSFFHVILGYQPEFVCDLQDNSDGLGKILKVECKIRISEASFRSIDDIEARVPHYESNTDPFEDVPVGNSIGLTKNEVIVMANCYYSLPLQYGYDILLTHHQTIEHIKKLLIKDLLAYIILRCFKMTLNVFSEIITTFTETYECFRLSETKLIIVFQGIPLK
ncbi:hypothetical protein ABK040_007749 [Willaertia magna]